MPEEELRAEEEQVESAATEETEETEEVEETEESKPRKKSAQQRIRELTAKYRQTEREVQELRQLLDKQQKKPESAPPQKPDRDQFDDDDAYFEALADYKYEVRRQKEREQEQQQRAQSEKQQRQQTVQQNIQKINETGISEFEDYEDVVYDPSLPLTNSMVEAVSEMDKGHHVLYYLGNNPDKAAEIAQKTPYRQAIDLSKIEAQLQKPRKPTQAPPPTNPVKPGGETADQEPDNIEDWMKWRWGKVRGK